jgi:hypothetical protein
MINRHVAVLLLEYPAGACKIGLQNAGYVAPPLMCKRAAPLMALRAWTARPQHLLNEQSLRYIALLSA